MSAGRFSEGWASGASIVLPDKSVEQVVVGVTVVGRTGGPSDEPPDVDLTAYDTAQLVSRRHVELRFAGNLLTIRDLDSTNGTRVDGVSLLPGRDYALSPNDVVMVGEVGLRVVAAGGHRSERGNESDVANRTRLARPRSSDPHTRPDGAGPDTASLPASTAGSGRGPTPVPETSSGDAPLRQDGGYEQPLPNATIIPGRHRRPPAEPEAEPTRRGFLASISSRLRKKGS